MVSLWRSSLLGENDMLRSRDIVVSSIRTIYLAALVMLGGASLANATEDGDVDTVYSNNIGKRFSIGLAVGYETFNTNLKITDKPSGRDIFVDMEGTLGLPETDTIPILYGYYRPTPKHGFGFSYFHIRREGSIAAIDENFGDLNVTGNVSMEDRTSFYYLSYNYTAYEDDRAFIFVSFGLYGLDLEYNLVADGTITDSNIPIASGQYEQNINILAPLPLLGIDAWFAVTPKLAIGAKASIVGGSYDDVSALVIQSKIRARYSLGERFALNMGLNFLDADITIDRSDRTSDVRYGFSGVTVGLDYRF